MSEWMVHFAVAVSAISGVLAAREKQIDLFGVIVLAFVTAVGGGTLRDLALGDTPVFWIKDPSTTVNAFITAVLMFGFARFWTLPERVLLVADAFGLALFAIVGVEKGLAYHTPGIAAVMLGIMTGVAGGVLRDLLVGEIPLVMRSSTHLYATAAFCGAVLYIQLKNAGVSEELCRSAGMLVTLLMRLVAVYWKLRLPEFKAMPREK